MSCLNDIDGACCRHNGNAKTQQVATSLELGVAAVGHCEAVDDCAKDDKHSSHHHAHSTTEAIDDGTSEGKSSDSTNLVHGGCQCRPHTVGGSMEEVEEG